MVRHDDAAGTRTWTEWSADLTEALKKCNLSVGPHQSSADARLMLRSGQAAHILDTPLLDYLTVGTTVAVSASAGREPSVETGLELLRVI